MRLNAILVLTCCFFGSCSLHKSENSGYKIFRAEETQMAISSNCLSKMEVNVEMPRNGNKITLFGWNKTKQIDDIPNSFIVSLGPLLSGEHDSKIVQPGPLISDVASFVIVRESDGEHFLVQKELKLKRLFVIPVTDMKTILLQKDSGAVVSAPSEEFTGVIEKWIQEN